MKRWRLIPDYSRYAVSDDGEVKKIGRGLMKQIQVKGYYVVSLVRDDGRNLQRKVHQLVLEAFVGPRPEGTEGCHFPDRSPTNNNLANLRWGTHRDNTDDMLKHGSQTKGEDSHCAKLREEQVLEIRETYAKGGMTQRQLADRFGVSSELVHQIVKGLVWKHLPMPQQTNFSNRRGNGWKKLI